MTEEINVPEQAKSAAFWVDPDEFAEKITNVIVKDFGGVGTGGLGIVHLRKWLRSQIVQIFEPKIEIGEYGKQFIKKVLQEEVDSFKAKLNLEEVIASKIADFISESYEQDINDRVSERVNQIIEKKLRSRKIFKKSSEHLFNLVWAEIKDLNF